MKRILAIIAEALFALALNAQNNPLEVKQFELSNGMQVWLNQDKSQPIVYGAVVVRAGAKDCPDTGLAHYLEHLLFKGTEELGTVDYELEAEYTGEYPAGLIARIAALGITTERPVEGKYSRFCRRLAEVSDYGTTS